MVHVMHVYCMLFEVFKNLISFSEDNMPGHALNIFIENAIKREKRGSNFKVTPKLCSFLYNAMETTGVHQGMIVMHSV